jgi:phosphoribosylformylglycinamidine synthase subunit PurL
VVAGEVIQESLVRILFQGEVAAEIPATALADNTPIYHRELLKEAPEYAQTVGHGGKIVYLFVMLMGWK